MPRIRRVLTVAAALFAITAPAFAQQIAGNTQNTGTTTTWVGQGFTAGTAGNTYGNISFSFLDGTGTNEAAGNLYLFNAPCGCKVSTVATSPWLAMTTASGNAWTFDPSFSLTGGNNYYVYSSTKQTVGRGDQQFADPSALSSYFAANATTGFYTESSGITYDFTVSSVAAAPEPAAWMLTILGMGMAGGVLRRRARSPGAALDAMATA